MRKGIFECAGFPVSFRRRRYGRQFYTWVYVHIGQETVGLGDPWPCVTPKRSEIEAAIKQEMERRSAEFASAAADEAFLTGQY